MPLQTAGSLGVHAIVRANRVEQRYGHSNDPNDCSHFHGKLVDSIFTDYSDTLAGLDGQRDITHGRGQHSVTLERDGEAINLERECHDLPAFRRRGILPDFEHGDMVSFALHKSTTFLFRVVICW